MTFFNYDSFNNFLEIMQVFTFTNYAKNETQEKRYMKKNIKR